MYEITEESRSDVEGMAENPNALAAYRKRIKADKGSSERRQTLWKNITSG
jgi:hypothetical protein